MKAFCRALSPFQPFAGALCLIACSEVKVSSESDKTTAESFSNVLTMCAVQILLKNFFLLCT